MPTLSEINRRIAKLQKQADDLKRREKKGVVEKIRLAISHYGITAAELGLDGAGGGGPKPAADATAAARSRRSGAKRAVEVRYRNAAGLTWSGRGKRPNWFKAELAAGRSPEDLLVESARPSAQPSVPPGPPETTEPTEPDPGPAEQPEARAV